MPLQFNARFAEADLYVGTFCRNNPKKGVKHLRCFPCCSPLGHRESTFCGRPLNVEITVYSSDADQRQAIDIHDLLYVGEFVPVSALNEQPLLQVSQQWVDGNFRTLANPMGNLYRGVVTSAVVLRRRSAGDVEEKQAVPDNSTTRDERTINIRFNDGETSAWQCGIRTSANIMYGFCVRVLRLAPEIVVDADDSYEEIFRTLSPPFMITSARRLSSVKASVRELYKAEPGDGDDGRDEEGEESA